ncbi:MAG: 23S rRNA (adenine(2503)-C(2))-methyltransferase RlmN [bacterium]|nr:23S rRNA (adenine(2503)-C(2))-methyltransferase RlmN [bacterium]
MIRLTDLTPEQISEHLGLKSFQGRQIFQWIHRKQVFDFEQMTNLSKELRKTLTETCVAAQLTPVEGATSATSQGTRKALFRLHDGETVESVLISDRERITLCLSTQVGCAVKCSFCATGQSGFARNLSAGEIAEQALHLVAGMDLAGRTPNIVYMGMGEPFRNYDATMSSIRLLMRKDGLGIGARKITVSTVGDLKGIQRFAAENWQVRLSISLHAANDALRSQLVPLNKKFPLKKLMAAVREYVEQTSRQVTFEWTLLGGVNDRPKDVAELTELVRDLRASVNLIPYNPVAEAEYEPPSREKCEAFRDGLEARGVNANLRRERGGDIDAACGQLRRRVAEKGDG